MKKHLSPGQPPDILSAARTALDEQSGARNVFVFPSGAFADFRLDAGPGDTLRDVDGDLFELFDKNGKTYARMKTFWYDAFVIEWNNFFSDKKNMIMKSETPRYKYDDKTMAALYLASSLVDETDPKESDVDEADFPLIRRAMDVPYLYASRSADAFIRELLSFAGRLRVANARALALHKSRTSIRACALLLLTFFTFMLGNPRFFG